MPSIFRESKRTDVQRLGHFVFGQRTWKISLDLTQQGFFHALTKKGLFQNQERTWEIAAKIMSLDMVIACILHLYNRGEWNLIH